MPAVSGRERESSVHQLDALNAARMGNQRGRRWPRRLALSQRSFERLLTRSIALAVDNLPIVLLRIGEVHMAACELGQRGVEVA
jgi:hypothetical protein